MSDKVGRKWPIVGGLFLCGAGVWLTVVVSGIPAWIGAATVVGAGMALLYPALLASIGDVVHPQWRGTSLRFSGCGGTQDTLLARCSSA
ncbi:MAG: MFS transporter [Chloroflexi bacterium]|nr:MFS transporter [Chloroflexota bacterium]